MSVIRFSEIIACITEKDSAAVPSHMFNVYFEGSDCLVTVHIPFTGAKTEVGVFDLSSDSCFIFGHNIKTLFKSLNGLSLSQIMKFYNQAQSLDDLAICKVLLRIEEMKNGKD